MDGCWILSNAFSVPIEIMLELVLHLLILLLDFEMLNQLASLNTLLGHSIQSLLQVAGFCLPIYFFKEFCTHVWASQVV